MSARRAGKGRTGRRSGAPGSTGALSLHVVTPPGLEGVTARELEALGIAPGETEPGGVDCQGSAADLYAANLWLRTASRVVVRLGRFRATAFWELEKRSRHLPWEEFVAPGRAVRFRVTCRKSRLYHSDAVAERLAGVLEQQVGGVRAAAVREDDEATLEGADPAQLVVARLLHDTCTVSVDASGALLHRRGYRQAIARAPLRETLGAGMLLAGGWNARAPLLDPMCGSGTIPIEGARLARRIAPGIARRFAFMGWPRFDDDLWQALLARAREGELPRSPAPIQGSDRNAGAVAAARANAERAGVAEDVELSVRALSGLEPPGRRGWLVSNPPYGVRVGERDALRDLYAQLGHVARERLAGWTIALLSPDRMLDAQLRIPLAERLRTTNGGLPVRLLVGQVPGVAGAGSG